MSTVEFSFGQIEAVCAELNRIASDKRVAFAGRLKQLQKQGLMEQNRRPGRGKAGSYGFTDLMRFVVAIELVQAGLMPQMAARLVNGSWSGLQYTIFSATYTDEEMEEWQEMPFGPVTSDWYWMLTPEALRDMTEEGFGKYDHYESIMPVPVEEVAARLQSDREIGVFGEGWRMIVLHGTKIAKAAINIVEFQLRYATRHDIRAEIQAEFDGLKAMLEDSPFQGIEEATRQHFEMTAEAAATRMRDETLRARYHPSDVVLERQARRMVAKLKPHHLAYVRSGQFDRRDTPDLQAMNDLMAQGLLVPELESDTLTLVLSPLGNVIQRLSADMDIPPDAIEQWRRESRDKVNAAVQRKINNLLSRDPDNPRDNEALDQWARHGGKTPLSEIRGKEIARQFVGGVLEELNDDRESQEEFLAALHRAGGGRDGDDQKA